jgi:hypothetical protein
MDTISRLFRRRVDEGIITPPNLSEEDAIASVARKFAACGDEFILEDHEGYVRPGSLLDFWLVPAGPTPHEHFHLTSVITNPSPLPTQDAIRDQGMERVVKVKFILIDLAFWRANPMLAGLVRRILKTEVGTTVVPSMPTGFGIGPADCGSHHRTGWCILHSRLGLTCCIGSMAPWCTPRNFTLLTLCWPLTLES